VRNIRRDGNEESKTGKGKTFSEDIVKKSQDEFRRSQILSLQR